MSTTSTVTIPAVALEAAANGALFTAGKRENTPILLGVGISVAHGEFRAYSTDRYSAFRAVVTLPDEPGELAQIVIPATEILALVKTSAGRDVTLTVSVDDSDRFRTVTTAYAAWSGGSALLNPVEGNFPPLEGLFKPHEDLSGQPTFDIRRLAMLAKIKLGRNVDSHWVLSQNGGQSGTKTMPMRADFESPTVSYTVIIMPTTKLR